ncbi:MAG: hypothetical protein A2Y70_05230 [Candidatus Aminicenantes bacterium RBG_13_64_14]|nr:MAG: hypothetical protein A2Y70_05230 [Candidatus Aminicenantes bacterium RBG_13_64_14]
MARALRVAFKMASMYNPDHPAFKSSVNELMVKLEAIFVHISPLSIGFSPHALLIDNRFWEGERTYVDLAQLFHFRKIKRLEIRPGIPHVEFMRFASKIMLPVKSFIKEGGAQAIIKRENILHISLDVLDYSQVLLGEGEEIKDIWPYLLMEAVEESDDTKLGQLAGSFEKVVGKFNTEDLIQNEELHKNFAKFFHFLKTTSQEKHRTCAKQLLRTVVAARKTPTESKFEKLKLLISDLSEEDLASTLWEEIIGNDKFDSLSFSIFSRIIDKERHKKISTSLHGLFHTENPQNRRPEVESKIRILLSGASSQLHSEIYRQTLSNLLNEISFDKKLALDRPLLQRNYRFLLLVLLSQEINKETALAELKRIAEEWERIADEKDFKFLLDYHEVLEIRAVDLAGEPGYEEARRTIAEHVEGCILRGETWPELDLFIGKLGQSVHEWEAYFATVFKDRIVTDTLLRACFRFFPSHLEAIHAGIKKKASDSELLGKIADGLKSIDTPVSFDTLKKVYEAGDPAVKIRALQAMQNLKEFEEAFLFPILAKKNEFIQAEALILLMRNERTKHVAFTKLFGLPSPYGLRNKSLLRNLRIVERCDLRDALPYIEPLSERKDVWNRKVRQKAGRVLEKWRER